MKEELKGQGLLEAIIAVAVIAVGLSAVLALAGNNLKVSNISAQQVVAVNLAREGVEIIRNKRDSNWLAGLPFETGIIGTASDTEGVLEFDPAAGTWTMNFGPDNFSDPDTIIYRNDQSGTYQGVHRQAQPSGYTPTIYKRLIYINPICANAMDSFASNCGVGQLRGLRVLSTVQWSEKGNTRVYSVEERLFDWR